jgi:hypothetical protein
VQSSAGRARQETSPGESENKSTSDNVWSFLAATILAGFYFVTSAYISSHRLFWFDEIISVNIARLPRWAEIWAALARGADTQPPIYYLLVRLFDKLPMHSEVSVRLPCAMAMAAGLLITFDCTRRLTNGLHGLIAASVLTCSYLPYYGYEARPYAICFLLASSALWLWTYSGEGGRLVVVLFGAALFVGVAFHYYFVLCLVPFMLYEMSHWKPWQPISAKLIAGIVGIIVPTALLSPLALAFSRQPLSFYAHPSWHELREVYSNLFPSGLFLLALVMIWIVLMNKDDKGMVLQPTQPGEAVGWLFLSIPLAGFIVAELRTNAFADRYFIGALPGIAVAFSCCLWRHFPNATRISGTVLLLLASVGVARQLNVVRHPELADRFALQSATRAYLDSESLLLSEGKQFIFFSWGATYFGAQYYSKHSDRFVLLRTADDDLHHTDVQFNLVLDRRVQWWNLEDLEKHARETALISPTADALEAMKRAGFKPEVRFSSPIKVVYLK